MITSLNVWGMQPALYLAFVILISFAAFATILDGSGHTMIDQDGERESVIPYYLTFGTGAGLMVLVAAKWIEFAAYHLN